MMDGKRTKEQLGLDVQECLCHKSCFREGERWLALSHPWEVVVRERANQRDGLAAVEAASRRAGRTAFKCAT